MNNKFPLVSVVIITYNSEKTIIETLESIKNQTYKNIELIISDDFSKDNTVEICKQWLVKNNIYFNNSKLIESPQNTGIAPNLNRGIKESKGEWIKSLAGDDTLTTDAIQKYIEFIQKNNCQICVGNLNLFSEENLNLNELQNTYDLYHNYLKEDLKQQIKRIYNEYTIPGPGFFYSRWIYNLIGGFDEKYPFCEEWPFAYKILKSGHKFFACPHRIVNYRISKDSLCREKNNGLINFKLYYSIRCFYYDYLQYELIKRGRILTVIENHIEYLIKDAMYENNIKKSQNLKLLFLISPLHYIKFIKTKFHF